MIQFVKMQGIGNDFVMIDAVSEPAPPLDPKTLCDRRLGVGADGVIIVSRGEQAPFRMTMFNPDGSESEMCGNGIRCAAVLLRDRGHLKESSAAIETGAGILHTEILAGSLVRVDMGVAKLGPPEIGMSATGPDFVDQPVGDGFRGTAVSMGNPHLAIFVEDVQKVDLETLGPKFERHELFPQRTNVHFAKVESRERIVQRTWERGAGATLACGTGACSVGVAGFLTGRTDRSVEIQLPGGTLQIEYREDGRVYMTGPAETVFTGRFA